MAASQLTSSGYTQTTVSRSQNCLSALTSGQKNTSVEGPKTQPWLKMSHDLPFPSSYWLLGDPSFNTQLPIFGIQGAGVGAGESEDLHKATEAWEAYLMIWQVQLQS